jgi:hypothetical protein
MSDPLESTHLKLPYLAAAQAQKHVTHNEALRRLDAVVQLAVLDSGLADPPASPADGDRYIVAAGATGAWSGHDGEIAAWTDGAWAFAAPQSGWLAFDVAAGVLLVREAADWTAIGAFLGTVAQLGINATADETNRLAVMSEAVLFTGIPDAAGGSGDMRAVVNKEADADTASLILQSGFSGRAEIGLAGDTDLVFKVSADGESWIEAIRIDEDTGLATILYDNATSGLSATTVQGAIDEVAAGGGGGEGAVASVFGRTGAVVAAASDYDASEVDNDSGVAGSTVAGALDALAAADGDRLALAGGTMTGDLVLAGDPDAALKAATRQYVDALLAAQDAMVFKGVVDCGANPDYPAADAGHVYSVSVAGKVGGGSGVSVEVGDRLLCLADSTAGGDQATVGASWHIVQSNIDGAVVGPASAVDSRVAAFDGASGKLIKDGGQTVAGLLDRASHTGTQTLATISDAGDAAGKDTGTGSGDVAAGDHSHAHFGDTDNPHEVTAAQVGLGSVDNTADADKPVSTAQQAALDLKQDIAGGKFVADFATVGNVNLAGGGLANGTTHNNHEAATGEIAFVGSQTDASENGFYTVPATAAASRTSGWTTWEPFVGLLVTVRNDEAVVDLYHCLAGPDGTLDTDDLVFANHPTEGDLGALAFADDAGDVPIADAGGFYAGGTVEEALAEIAAKAVSDPGWGAGQWRWPFGETGALGNKTPTTSAFVVFYQFFAGGSTTLATARIALVTGQTGAEAWAALYEDDEGRPSDLIEDLGAQSLAGAAGDIDWTPTATVQGFFWLGIYVKGVATQATVRGPNDTGIPLFIRADSSDLTFGSASHLYGTTTYPTSAADDPAPSIGTGGNLNVPMAMLQAAA